MSEQTRDDVINIVVNVEDWISSQEADVQLTVNMAVDDGMDTKAVIEQAFDEILKGNDWKVIDLTQFEDSTKMTKLNATIYARLDEQLLSNLEDYIKEIIKPGLQIQVSSIDFTPTLAEMEDFNHKLRKEVYDKIKDEIALLHEVNSGQKWRVGQVSFNDVALSPFEIGRHYSGNGNNVLMASALSDDGGMGTSFGQTSVGGAEGFAIAKKIQLCANVRLHSLVN